MNNNINIINTIINIISTIINIPTNIIVHIIPYRYHDTEEFRDIVYDVNPDYLRIPYDALLPMMKKAEVKGIMAILSLFKTSSASFGKWWSIKDGVPILIGNNAPLMVVDADKFRKVCEETLK